MKTIRELIPSLLTKSRSNNVLHNNEKKERIAVFISIPRNASQSVLKILDLGPNRAVEKTTSLIIHENHQRAIILNQKYDLANLFVFCFSRNPYDRCVSWYEFHKNIEPYKSMSFETWIMEGMPHHWTVQNRTDYLAEGISPLLQYNFLEDNKVDFIGKLENFTQDMWVIIKKLNMICEKKHINHRFSYTNKKLNQSKRHASLVRYYNEKTEKKVYSILKKDFSYFNYERHIWK